MLINLLDKDSIQLAIDKLKKMGSTKNGKTAQGKGYIVSLLKDGTKYMRSIMPQDTGYLRETTDYDESTGKILVDAYYAAFVEYGTGIVGANSPHEHAGKWQYDASGYGKSGWYYRNNETGVAGFTRGQPASAFLLKTAQYLKKLGGDQIKVKVFANLDYSYETDIDEESKKLGLKPETRHYKFYDEYEVQ